jgi:aryl-alcohol dehydrogenase-like predicted oxidoreductase
VTLARVLIKALGQEVSALGFGCASLGSRIAPAAGLMALERAHDVGVTWFDVAPSYGDGQAETLLGRFLDTRPRDRVQVLTKVGIAPPPPSLKGRIVKPAMRAVLTVTPSLRSVVRRHRPAPAKLTLDGQLIERSLEGSLRRLGTDYVDVLALHDATADEVLRDDVRRALETAVASGKARAAAIASSPQAAVVGVGVDSVYGLAQIGNNLLDPGLTRFRAATSRHVDTITHSVFGNDGAIARLARRIEHDSKLNQQLRDCGYLGTTLQIAASSLADFAFADNSTGVVVVSMFSARHLQSNLQRRALVVNSALMRAFNFL